MAYGNGRRDTEKRVVEAGRVPLPDLSHPLRLICDQVRSLAEEIAAEIWRESPGAPLCGDKGLYPRTGPIAKRSGLNAVWAELARLLTEPAVREQHKRRSRHLFGILKNLNEDKAAKLAGGLIAPHVALTALCQALAALGWDEIMGLADAAFRGADHDPVRSAVLRGACATANEKFPRPTWAGPRADQARVRLNLDARCVRGGRAALTDHLNALTLSAVAARTGKALVGISGPAPRNAAITLPFRLVPALSGRYGPDAFVGSLSVEIGPNEAVLRAVMERRPAAKPAAPRHFMGWDFGYRNTLSSTLIEVPAEVPLARVRRAIAAIAADDKAACRERLSGHVIPDGVRVIRSVRYDGSAFMARMRAMADEISLITREIDRNYARMANLKREFLAGAGFEGEVPEALPSGLMFLTARHHARFWRVMGVIRRLKERRRGLYRKADGVRGSWFGLILNREMAEAGEAGAALCVENLTIVTERRDGPQYKGPAFNMMINHGARGQLLRRAEQKAKMAGVPMFEVPSPYTSTTDVRHAVVDKRQRRGDVFTAAADGRRFHADSFASFVVAVWPLLQEKGKKNVTTRSEPDLSALAA